MNMKDWKKGDGARNWRSRVVIGLALLGFMVFQIVAGVANAATVTVTWVPPTTNTDGSTIPATGIGSLKTYRIEYGTCSANGVFGTKAGEVTRSAPASTAVLNLNPGTACVRVVVSNTYDIESDASNVATSVVPFPKPSAPTQTSATP